MSSDVSMTRRELFELVWREPVSRAAERFRLSGTWLRKLCLEEDVPLPPRGHWARVRAGQEVKRPRLPHPERADAEVRIRLGAEERASPTPKRPEPAALTERRAFEARPGNRITVRAGSPKHAWARELARELRKGNALSQTGMREASVAAEAVKVSVAEASVARAVALVDALARALEKRGVHEAMSAYFIGLVSAITPWRNSVQFFSASMVAFITLFPRSYTRCSLSSKLAQRAPLTPRTSPGAMSFTTRSAPNLPGSADRSIRCSATAAMPSLACTTCPRSLASAAAIPRASHTG